VAAVSLTLAQLRLVGALAHSTADADVELHDPGRAWLVSHRRRDAALDPCGLRQVVLAAMRGSPRPVVPLGSVAFVGALRDIGGGVYERHGAGGPERRIATFLPVGPVEELVGGITAPPGLTASVHADDDLGVAVITVVSPHPVGAGALDAVAVRVAARCMVGELIALQAWEAS